jgi:hypothetical protein
MPTVANTSPMTTKDTALPRLRFSGALPDGGEGSSTTPPIQLVSVHRRQIVPPADRLDVKEQHHARAGASRTR